MRRTLLTFALTVLVAMPAGAQGLKLSFGDGRVSIDATAVPVRTILSEWAKLGGTKVVGAERITGAPLTLKLVDVPEAQALDIILRTVAGYMAAPRGAVAGASMYDRILVMATSSAPAPSAPAGRPNAPSGPGATAGTQRYVAPRPVVQRPEEDVEEEEEEEDPNPPNAPVFTFPQPGQPGFAQPGINGVPAGLNNQVITPQGIIVNPTAAPPAQPPGGPMTPFGGTGATAPGMIQKPLQPGQPGPVVRPPG